MDAPDRPGWYRPEPAVPAVAPDQVVADTVAGRSARRSRIGTGVAVAAIGIGALGVVGTAYAASSTPSPSASGSAPRSGSPDAGGTTPGQAPGRPWGMGGPDGRRHGGFGGMGIHGTFVTPKAGGGYQTVDTQVGTVTGVSATSLTVTSADGFTQSYVVDATTLVDAQRDGIGSIKAGDEVSVVATVSGSTRAAVRIEDRTQVGGIKGWFGLPGARHPGWPGAPGGNGTGPTGQGGATGPSGPTGAGTPGSGGTA